MNILVRHIALFIIIFNIASFAQKDTVYHLSVDAGIGYSRYITTMEFEDLNKYGFSGSLKIMWHPEHLLSLGVEAGYHYLYFIKSSTTSEFGSSEIEASMIALPLLFVTSMRVFPLTIPDLEIQGGGGVYFLFNKGKLFGRNINSSLYSFGYHLGAVYLYPVSDDVSLGGEFKYYYISKLQDSDISLKVVFSYNFFSW
jgi:hypothetical protein